MDNRLNADTPSVEQSLDQYLASVNKQFNEIENDINKIEQDQNKINQLEKDQADLASYIQTLSNLSGLDPTGGIEAQLEEMQDTYDEDGLLINLCNSDIDNLQSEIKKIDPQLAPIVDTLSLLLNASIGLGGAAKSKAYALPLSYKPLCLFP